MNNSRSSSFLLLALLLSCAGSTVMAMDKTPNKTAANTSTGNNRRTYQLILGALKTTRNNTQVILKNTAKNTDEIRALKLEIANLSQTIKSNEQTLNQVKNNTDKPYKELEDQKAANQRKFENNLNRANSDFHNLQVALGFLAATEIANYVDKVAIAKRLLDEDGTIHELVHKLKRASRTNTAAKSLLTFNILQKLGGSDVLERGSLRNGFVESAGYMTNYVIIEYLGGYLGKFGCIKNLSNRLPNEAKHIIKAVASQAAWFGEKLFINWLFGPAKSDRKQ